MAVELQTQEKTLIAILSGEIDHHCAQPMRAEIDAKSTIFSRPCWYWILPV